MGSGVQGTVSGLRVLASAPTCAVREEQTATIPACVTFRAPSRLFSQIRHSVSPFLLRLRCYAAYAICEGRMARSLLQDTVSGWSWCCDLVRCLFALPNPCGAASSDSVGPLQKMRDPEMMGADLEFNSRT